MVVGEMAQPILCVHNNVAFLLPIVTYYSEFVQVFQNLLF